MTRVAKKRPTCPDIGKSPYLGPLLQKKSDASKEKVEKHMRTGVSGSNETENAKRQRSENAKKKRAEKRRENRQAEKEKNSVCFQCRQKGHSVKNCPNADSTGTGICYHCGSEEHTTKQCAKPGSTFPYATCYVCKERGHLASMCQKNEKGLYPNGGGCKYCGSTKHLVKDCKPTKNNNAEATVGVLEQNQGGDDDDVFVALRRQQEDKEKNKATAGARKPKKVVVSF